MDRLRVPALSPYEELVGYSRAVRIGDRVLVSGTAPIPTDGGDPAPDAYGQALRCFEIVREALEAAGADPGDVVRTRAYLVDAEDWEGVGRAHGEAFGDAKPACTFVVVAGLLDPRWRVEVEAEAVVGP